MSKTNTWVCSKCGTENSDEFEICYQCGNLNRTPKSAEQKKDPQGKKKGGLKWIGILALLLVAVALGACAIFHFKASQAFAQGEYAEAAALAEYDLLFSEDLREAGQVEQAVKLWEEGSFTDALDICKAFPSNETAAEYADLCCIDLAKKALAGKDLSIARDYISQVSAKEGDVAKLNDEIYTLSAEEFLLKENSSEASKMLGEVIVNSYATKYRETIHFLGDGAYYDAILTAKAAAGNGYNQISDEKWEKIIAAYIKTAEEKGRILLDDCFQVVAAKSVISGGADFGPEKLEDSTSDQLRSFVMPEDQNYKGFNENLACEIWDNSKIGKTGEGKVLVLWEMDYYTSYLDNEYFIAWDIMELLPHECIPTSLEDVEHVVTIKCFGYKEGWYSGATNADAVRERAQLSLTTAGKRIRSTAIYAGPSCPSTIYGIYGSVVFGGLPEEDIQKQLYLMLRPLVNAEK